MVFLSQPIKHDEDQKSPSPIARPNLQTLSDLIFGLALSIGAISLLGQQSTGYVQIIESLSIFGFGFYLLVTVWYRYAAIVKILPFETSSLISLNLVLLFLVAIEPYLLNLLITTELGDQTTRDAVSQFYAVDYGSIYVILAYFMHQLITQEKRIGKEKLIRQYVYRETFFLLVAIAFYVSVVPFFGSINISNFTLREILWLAFLPIGIVFRLAGWFG